MIYALRYLLAIVLLLTGAFFGLAIILAFTEIIDAIIGIFSSHSAESFGEHLGSILAAVLFLAIIFFCFRTAIRIFRKTKKMKSEPESSSDILDDMM